MKQKEIILTANQCEMIKAIAEGKPYQMGAASGKTFVKDLIEKFGIETCLEIVKKQEEGVVVSTDIGEGALALAQRITAMHASVKKQYPRNYLTKMQPYVMSIVTFMKKNAIENPIEAVMAMADEKMDPKKEVWFFATAAEMLNNMANMTESGLIIPEEKKIQPLKILKKDGSNF